MSSAAIHPLMSPVAVARRAMGEAGYAIAEASARRALEDDANTANHAEAGLLLGRVLARTNRLDECILTLRTAIEVAEPVAPPTPEVRFDLRRELGQVLWAQSRKEEASRWFLAALSVRPDASEDAEARRIITDLELQVLVGAGEVDRAAEYAFEILDSMLASGLSEDDWRRVFEILRRLDELKSTEVTARVVAWLEVAETHRSESSDARDCGELQLDHMMVSLREYTQRMRQTHPRDLGEEDVQELERQFELAWKVMDAGRLVNWLADAAGPFFLARYGWKSALALWRRVFDRADRYVGCAASTAWHELAGAAAHLAGWCQEVGEFCAAVQLRQLVFEADKSAGYDFSTAISGRSLARTLLVSGHPDEALRALDEAAEFRQRDQYAANALAVWSRRLRADILASAGDPAAAEALIREQLEADFLEYGEDSAHVGWDALRLAELLADIGHNSEAAELLARVATAPEEDGDSLPGDREWQQLVRRLRLCKLRLKLEEGQRAVDELLSVANEAAAILGSGNTLEAEALTEWAAAATTAGMRDTSVEEVAVRALEMQCHLRNPGHPKAVRAAEVVRLVRS